MDVVSRGTFDEAIYLDKVNDKEEYNLVEDDEEFNRVKDAYDKLFE